MSQEVETRLRGPEAFGLARTAIEEILASRGDGPETEEGAGSGPGRERRKC